MPVLPAVPSTTVPPALQLAAALGVQHDGACGAVLDRAARIHELGLAEDLAAGFLAHAAQAHQRRVADRAGKAVDDTHARRRPQPGCAPRPACRRRVGARRALRPHPRSAVPAPQPAQRAASAAMCCSVRTQHALLRQRRALDDGRRDARRARPPRAAARRSPAIARHPCRTPRCGAVPRASASRGTLPRRHDR